MEQGLNPFSAGASVWAFWRPRLARICDWFVAQERLRRARGIFPAVLEADGTLDLVAAGGPFRIRGRADRIDRLPDGSFAVIDYKTGKPPKKGEVIAGWSPQLTLEALMLADGQIGGLSGPVSELAYWSVSGRGEGGTVTRLEIDVAEAVRQARDGLSRLVDSFDDPHRAYPATPRLDRLLAYEEYEHLARRDEWLESEPE
jgi:ATP-dependent helicase/nuclease subunit B